MWDFVKKLLGYNDAELEEFKKTPRNLEVLQKTAAMLDKTIVITVASSNGCASGHREGAKFYFDTSGNLLTKLAPKRVCIHALHSMQPLIYAAVEMLLAGVDPNQMRFSRASCIDVGRDCGGWGRVVLELTVESREAAQKGQ